MLAELSASTPASTGPTSNPRLDTKLIDASALAARRSPRTTWVWLPVQKHARATPCNSCASVNGMSSGDSAASPHDSASVNAAPTTSTQSPTRRITAPSTPRVAICAMAEAAVRTPTSAAE